MSIVTYGSLTFELVMLVTHLHNWLKNFVKSLNQLCKLERVTQLSGGLM